MKLNEFVSEKAISELVIARTEIVPTESGEKVAILHLKQPLASVTGSQSIIDDASGETVRIEAYDVEAVKIHESDMEDDGFNMNEDGSGTYKGDLRLDVAKGSGDVWLKATSFAASAREMRKANRTERQGGLLSKIRERQKAAKTTNAARPTVVVE